MAVSVRRQRRAAEPKWDVYVGEFIERTVVNGVSAAVLRVWRQGRPDIRHRMTILNPDFFFMGAAPGRRLEPGLRVMFTLEVKDDEA